MDKLKISTDKRVYYQTNREEILRKNGLRNKERPEVRKIWESKNKERMAKWRREWRKNPEVKEKERFNYFKTRYGMIMTYEEYNNFLDSHANLCAICGKPETAKDKAGNIKKLSIDHCHKTNKIRGLLCSSCNIALGGFQDDIVILRKAIKYLLTK